MAQTLSSISVNSNNHQVSLSSKEDLRQIFLFQISQTADSFYSGGQWSEAKWKGDIIFQTKDVWTACFSNLPDSGWQVGYTAYNKGLTRASAKFLWWIPEREGTGKYETAGKASWGIFPSQFSSVPLLSHVWLFATPQTAECQASLSITNSRSLLKLMSIKSDPFSLSVPLIFC